MTGGLARLSAAVESVRSRTGGDILLVDVGGFLPKKQDAAAIENMMAAYELIGFSAINLSSLDLLMGGELFDLETFSARLPLTSANAVFEKGKKGVPRVMTVTVGGRHIGMIGISPNIGGFKGQLIKERHGVSFLTVGNVLPPVIRDLRPQVDILLLVSHLSYYATRYLVDAHPELDAAICPKAASAGANHPKILQVSETSKFVSMAMLKVDADKTVSLTGTETIYTGDFQPSEQMLGLIGDVQPEACEADESGTVNPNVIHKSKAMLNALEAEPDAFMRGEMGTKEKK
ncbi:MAG: hypothetical protein CSA22_03990 [Deltaproteobacteria bacterium]|nr:MAG: hypothetical protein CSA22_03990 [Deltaproteobacteria bacterium]